MTATNVLITNLSYASVNCVRMHVSAVLIEPHNERMPSFSNDKCVRVRGFGPDAAWPVFDIRLNTDDPTFELQGMESRDLFIGENEDGTSKDPKPLFTGGILTFKDDMQVVLHKGSFDSRGIDFSEHEVDGGDGYDDMWKILQAKCAEYWDSPNMPLLQYVPASRVRSALSVPEPAARH